MHLPGNYCRVLLGGLWQEEEDDDSVCDQVECKQTPAKQPQPSVSGCGWQDEYQ